MGAFVNPTIDVEDDRDARWFKVAVSQSLGKTVEVSTKNYQVYYDEDKQKVVIDTYGINWADELIDNKCLTPLGLIKLFKYFLERDLKSLPEDAPETAKERYRYLIDECDNWTEEDLYITEVK